MGKFERTFQWSMRHGARILFSVGLLLALGGPIIGLFYLLSLASSEFTAQPSNAQLMSETISYIFTSYLGLLGSAAWLLFGALVVDRLDRSIDRVDRWTTERRDRS